MSSKHFLIDLKVGQWIYPISSRDCFSIDGDVVKLITESNYINAYGNLEPQKLSKKAVREISKFEWVYLDNFPDKTIKIFSLRKKVKNETNNRSIKPLQNASRSIEGYRCLAQVVV